MKVYALIIRGCGADVELFECLEDAQKEMKRQWESTVAKKFPIEVVDDRYVVTGKVGEDLFAPEYCYIDKTYANFDFPFASSDEAMYWDIKEKEVKPA